MSGGTRRRTRRVVIDLTARRRAPQRPPGPSPSWWRGNRGQAVPICVPFHLDDHEPELEMSPDWDAIVHLELPQVSRWERLAVLHEAVAEQVAREVRADGVPVVQSGCCTTALGTVAGLQRAGVDPSVVWFDAHGDLHTPETSASGYPGGMALRQLLGEGDRTSPDRLGLSPVLEVDTVLVGGRDLDPPEVEFLASSSVGQLRVDEVVGTPLPPGPLYLHVDLDVLDPQHLRSPRFPAPGGPDPRQLWQALRVVMLTGRVAAVGVACSWLPDVYQDPRVIGIISDLRELADR